MASEEGRGTGLASSVVLFILEITSQVPTRFPAPSGGGWPSACQPPLPTCRGSQGPTWISLWTSAESGSLTPQETMERDGSRNASPARTSPARASPSRSASGRSLSARSASTASSPTRVYLVRATPVGAVPIRASPARSAPATRESPGVSLPKFTWQEGQKRLPLIGCILLLIALVVSLIILYGGREPQSPRGIAVYFWRGHTGIKYKEPVESCPIHAVRCDGVVDCKLRSDELGCVRFDWNKSLLKVYSGSSHQWLPICSDSWNDSYSEKTCQQLGFMSAYRTTEVAHGDLTSSLSISTYNSTLQESLYRSECPSQQYVSLQCSHCGLRAMTGRIGRASSRGLAGRPSQRATTVAASKGYTQGVKTWLLLLLRGRRSPGTVRVDRHLSYPALSRTCQFLSAPPPFSFSAASETARTRTLPWREGGHCPQALQIAVVKDLSCCAPVSCQCAWPPCQLEVWASLSLSWPVQFSSLSWDSQRQGPSRAAQPSSRRWLSGG
ncbi:transmembrane protease serine 13 isoform X3 [Prionailurus bengalensis]|uniref:transmembrane protease serine 13 isoform X3 n=1 Tax=Prionailurus bengalensis TaxID=37029 RepID=UPI001CA9B933|nr:transmembrane protease serine 13 isoform X3 [Prionailurus bengalensis]